MVEQQNVIELQEHSSWTARNEMSSGPPRSHSGS